MSKENYEALGGRDGLLVAMHQALNDLRRFPYLGFVPEDKRAGTVGRLAEAIQYMETHPAVEFLPTRMLFPVLSGETEVRLAKFLQQQNFHFCHDMLFAPIHPVTAALYLATSILYPEVLMDLRSAYAHLHKPPPRSYFTTEPAPLGPR